MNRGNDARAKGRFWKNPAGFLRDSDGSFIGRGLAGTLDPRCHLSICLLYALTVSSVPQGAMWPLAILASFPAFSASSAGIPAIFVAERILPALPLALMMGGAWLLIPGQPAGTFMGLTVTTGMTRAVSILIKLVLTVASCSILAACAGFRGISAALASWGVPGPFIRTLGLIHRYSIVLAEEAGRMMDARWCRLGSVPLTFRDYSCLAGSLLHRAMSRGARITMAMEARGINPGNPDGLSPSRSCLNRWRPREWFFFWVWAGCFVAVMNLGGLR